MFADGTMGNVILKNENGASAVALFVDSEDKVMTHESVYLEQYGYSRHLLTDNYILYNNTIDIMKQKGTITE